MPMQIPSTGTPRATASSMGDTRPRRRISSMVAPKAPSPGRTSAEAERSSSGSPVSRVPAPE